MLNREVKQDEKIYEYKSNFEEMPNDSINVLAAKMCYSFSWWMMNSSQSPFFCRPRWSPAGLVVALSIVVIKCSLAFIAQLLRSCKNCETLRWWDECWWFRNPKANHLECIEPVVNNGITYQPTSTGEFTGFLNHPTGLCWKIWALLRGIWKP